jgi:hypothetical protein
MMYADRRGPNSCRSSQEAPVAPFDRRTSIALAVVGACTLNLPLVSVSKPVFGRMQWTALDFFMFVHSRSTPVFDVLFNRFIVGIGIAYLCLFVFLVLLWIPSSRSLLWVTAFFGTIWAFEPLYWGTQEVAKLWFGSNRADPLLQIHYAFGTFMLPAMMAGLWWSATVSGDADV